MTRRRVPTRLRIVIGLVALPALAWSTPLIAGAQAGPSQHSAKSISLPDLQPRTGFGGQPHDPENEQGDDEHEREDGDGRDDDRCDDAHEGTVESHESDDDSNEGDDDDDQTEHTGTTVDCGPAPVVSEAPLAVGLPIAGAGVIGAVVLFRRRRPRAVN